MLVGVGDAPIVFFFEFVFRGAGVGVAALPKCFDELLPFIIRAQILERFPFLIGDDVRYFLLNPLLVGAFIFLRGLLLPLLLGFVGFILLDGNRLDGMTEQAPKDRGDDKKSYPSDLIRSR